MVHGMSFPIRPTRKCAKIVSKCSTFKALSRSLATQAPIDNEVYQYLQRSKLPTMYFQPSLPRLPIPMLGNTCKRFLAAVQPILTADEYYAAESAVQEFQQGVGQKLQAILVQHDLANKHTSYISQPWFDMYLGDRAPLPLNYNPLLVMKSDTRPEYQHQVVRAANLVISSLRFWRSLQAGLLEPEVFHINAKKSDTEQFRRWAKLAPTPIATYVAYAFKAFPLDMSQYNRLFGVSRIPELQKDRIVEYPNSRHILVMRRGNMYAVDVLDTDGNILAPMEILARIERVVQLDASRAAAETPLGVLTAIERDAWARTRNHIVNSTSDTNRQLLTHVVDAALFCLSLDCESDPVYDEKNPVPLFKHLLAGEAKNRWFDKSVSLIISADGTPAINFEHSWGDGVAVLRYFNEIYKDTLQSAFVQEQQLNSNTVIDECSVLPIEFEFDDRLRADVQHAIDYNSNRIEQLNMNFLRYAQLSKNACKGYRVSPDSIMQLAFQLAYRRAFDAYVGTYESCSTAAFRHGRTETMRPCTMATKEFCDAMLQPSNKRIDANALLAMIDNCSATHGQLTKNAAMGQGFDRHLFALKHMAYLNNIDVPSIYDTEAYRKINYNIISTSTLSSNALLGGSFGPVVPDGLGIGYSILDEECGAVVTSYKNGCNGKYFTECLEQSFNDIKSILETTK